MQDEAASWSSVSEHEIVADWHHYIQLEQPERAVAPSSVLAHSLDDAFGHRALAARELIHTGAQVRTQLSSRIGNIADVAELVEGVTVVLKDCR